VEDRWNPCGGEKGLGYEGVSYKGVARRIEERGREVSRGKEKVWKKISTGGRKDGSSASERKQVGEENRVDKKKKN